MFARTALRSLVVGACASLVLSACGGGPADGDDGTSVVAAFYPFAYVSARVAGDHATVTNLTSTGAEPHDLELTPQDVAEVASADLVVYERGFQPAVDDAVEENTDGTVLDVAETLPGGALEADPHLWLDPTELARVTRAVADRLAEADPEHASSYRANAAALADDLQTLDRAYRQGLADCARDTFVTSHAAFGHLAARYGLRMISIAGLSPDVEPSPARLAELETVVSRSGVTTVFSERLASPELARTLASEVGVRTDVLDPIEGLSDATAQESYLTLMRSNLAALRKANGCR